MTETGSKNKAERRVNMTLRDRIRSSTETSYKLRLWKEQQRLLGLLGPSLRLHRACVGFPARTRLQSNWNPE